jgi:AraC-like DNA-binding protein
MEVKLEHLAFLHLSRSDEVRCHRSFIRPKGVLLVKKSLILEDVHHHSDKKPYLCKKNIMDNSVSFFSWRELDNIVAADAIGSDFFLLNNPVITDTFSYPFKVDVTTAIICTRGTMRGSINLKLHASHAPCMMVVLADQILQHEYVSPDFECFLIIMSKRFTETLFGNAHDRLPLFRSIQDSPTVPLNKATAAALLEYYAMMQKTIRATPSPYLMEIAIHLTKAFFYAIGSSIHNLTEREAKSKHEILVNTFLSHVQAHYKEQRDVAFYANKMCLTPKHLSKVIKDNSGLSASDWVEKQVILEAKALLKSTNKTIQQISDELNFPTQSFFGKYFKRIVGVSPSEYRR